MNAIDQELEDRIISYITYEGFINDIDTDDYTWSIDISFDPKIVTFVDTENLAKYLEEANDRDFDGHRPGEQFYDSYWGWWCQLREGTLDMPVVIQYGKEWVTLDGWHRMLIARLAGIKAVPVIKGILKEDV